MLTLDRVSKTFSGLRAVWECSFEVPERGVTGIVGPNGAGKTTTFNLIAGALHPDSGLIRYRDRVVNGLSQQARVRLGIGRTFQDVRLFGELSAVDNVAVAVPDQPGERLTSVFLYPAGVRRRERENRRLAHRCLEEVGFDPDKGGAPASDLSYGEQKLISLARLLALGVDTLLLDEPASGLDESSLEQLRGVVRRLVQQGKTVLLIEHNMQLVRQLCDFAVFMNEGTVLAHGEPGQLMTDERLQRVYLGGPLEESLP